MNQYTSRINNYLGWMKEEGNDAVIFHDLEATRSKSIRYLCGHPMDATLFLFATGKTVLAAWDVNMAEKMASVDEIKSQNSYGRDPIKTMASILKENVKNGGRVELPSSTSHYFFKQLEAALPEFEIISRENGSEEAILGQRMIKDRQEIALYKEAGKKTSEVFESIVSNWNNFETEIDVAAALEAEGRKRGAEGMGFDTIVAGPSRSFGLHAFPSYSNGSVRENGLTIIDFGLVFQGYSTDITTTIVKGNVNDAQEEMISLVEEAYNLSTNMLKPGVKTTDLAGAVGKHFKRANHSMPHSLGHGIGLDIHEFPFVREPRSENDEGTILKPGMIITIEPGLYDPEFGGVRYENDFLITEEGAEVITKSRIVRLP